MTSENLKQSLINSSSLSVWEIKGKKLDSFIQAFPVLSTGSAGNSKRPESERRLP